MKKISLAIALTLTACSVQIKPGADRIALNKADPSPACQEVGNVKGTSGWGDIDTIKNQMRNEALEKGANYVRMETSVANQSGAISMITGTAFKCPAGNPN